jgi:hypothetical protein
LGFHVWLTWVLGLIQADCWQENKKCLEVTGNGKSLDAITPTIDDSSAFNGLFNGITEEPKLIPNIRLPLN